MSAAPQLPYIQFFSTAPLPCPYLTGQVERKMAVELRHETAVETLNALTLGGFRRSHAIAYVPACPSCDACLPARVPVDRFTISRNLKRVRNRNADLIAAERPAIATDEQFDLFHSYLTTRHGDGDMATMAMDDYQNMVEDTPVTSSIIEFRDANGRLVAACLMDQLRDGLSAVYSFFAADRKDDSLGSFMILWLIEEARRRKLDHVYLGYWIEKSQKMAYKARFRPLETFRDGEWVTAQPLDR